MFTTSFFSTVIYAVVIFNRYQDYALLSTGSELYGLKILSIMNVNKSPNVIKLSIILEVNTQRRFDLRVN